MWISNISLLLSLVTALPLYRPYYKLTLDNPKLISQKILNDTFNEVYNNITESIKNNHSFYVFKSPFCEEPENLYNKIKHTIYDKITHKPIVNINNYKPLCPINYNYGYILWSNNIPLKYFVPVNRIKKYIRFILRKLNTTFPNSNIISVYNVSSENRYTIFGTNCCPFYNISL
jgi:hypothetical protein